MICSLQGALFQEIKHSRAIGQEFWVYVCCIAFGSPLHRHRQPSATSPSASPLLHLRRHPSAASPVFCHPICLGSIDIDLGKKRRRRLCDLSIVQNTPNLEEGNSEQQTVVGSSNVAETLDDPEEFQKFEDVRCLVIYTT
ncbi:uncharacterized protein [Gossypium hirsutum]|uniref:Uncharacterized protein isoform X1 n=1 Tax=Gossypium hirsutum TaxID=3635 RepID=A0A1U8NXL9_GOSHI|nr:uncharacterized protein LOC107952994 isoform X1 [Gossypium hirsutum]